MVRVAIQNNGERKLGKMEILKYFTLEKFRTILITNIKHKNKIPELALTGKSYVVF